MDIPFVDLYAQYRSIKAEIDLAISEVISQSAFIRSDFVVRFEQEFAEAVGVKRCVSCGNGTDALFIGMKALGVKAGDEVITTAHSWISTSETITQAGARVVFSDTEDDYYTIDPSLIEAKITSRTVGIIAVHLFGQPARMDSIMEIAKKHKLWVIEDCAQAHLATFNGQKVGTFGNLATFSFYPGKNLGAMGDAGAIVTNDETIANWCELYSRHGGKGTHLIEGVNSRMDGLQAAVLSVKLPYLEQWNSRRSSIAAFYSQRLGILPDVVCPKVGDGRGHVWHLYVVRTKRRDRLRSFLQEKGIPTVLNYPRALPFYPAYSYLGHVPEDFPVAHIHQQEILSLPIFPELTDGSASFVAESILSFF